MSGYSAEKRDGKSMKWNWQNIGNEEYREIYILPIFVRSNLTAI